MQAKSKTTLRSYSIIDRYRLRWKMYVGSSIFSYSPKKIQKIRNVPVKGVVDHCEYDEY